MKVIMFHSEKGGTGKTTLSTLTAAYAAAVGLRVLLVDFDPQGHATVMFGIDKQPGVFKVMTEMDDFLNCIVSPHVDSYSPTGDVSGQLWVLPGDKMSYGIPNIVTDVKRLDDVLGDVENSFDLVIIDTAPTAGLGLTLVYQAADYVVVPTQMEDFSLDGLVATIDATDTWGCKLLGVVPNMVKRTVFHDLNYDELKMVCEENNWRLFDRIYDRIEWAESVRQRTVIYALNRATSKARQEALMFCQTLMGVIYEQA